MYPDGYRHEDSTTCPHCGVETEVIGPPGPTHQDGCPHKPAPRDEGPNLTDEEFAEALGRGTFRSRRPPTPPVDEVARQRFWERSLDQHGDRRDVIRNAAQALALRDAEIARLQQVINDLGGL
jgi:hypothetical protein